MALQLFAFSKAGVIKNPEFAYLCISRALEKLPDVNIYAHKWVLLWVFLSFSRFLNFNILAASDIAAIRIFDDTSWYEDSATTDMPIIAPIAIHLTKANGTQMVDGDIKKMPAN